LSFSPFENLISELRIDIQDTIVRLTVFLRRPLAGGREDISLVGPANTWRAWGACKFFDSRIHPQKREIGEAISAWYQAMSMSEIKWGGFRFAEPRGRRICLIPTP
jgi:hypothetical protein